MRRSLCFLLGWALPLILLLLLLLLLAVWVLRNAIFEIPRTVPAEQMMADWRELERLARQYPYQDKRPRDERR